MIFLARRSENGTSIKVRFDCPLAVTQSKLWDVLEMQSQAARERLVATARKPKENAAHFPYCSSVHMPLWSYQLCSDTHNGKIAEQVFQLSY
jgi:hypothetical protein